jgi:hypothetical protein
MVMVIARPWLMGNPLLDSAWRVRMQQPRHRSEMVETKAVRATRIWQSHAQTPSEHWEFAKAQRGLPACTSVERSLWRYSCRLRPVAAAVPAAPAAAPPALPPCRRPAERRCGGDRKAGVTNGLAWYDYVLEMGGLTETGRVYLLIR